MAPETTGRSGGQQKVTAPSISLPKGGGAIRGIGEKFAANPVSGTGSMSVPINNSRGRVDFGPQLSLSYDSGAGNGPFGFGWGLSLPAITRKTDKGLPRYGDDPEDVFILSDAEDLVPVLEDHHRQWRRHSELRSLDGRNYSVHRYRPRVEQVFARIERWTDAQSGEVHWRSFTRENVTTLYGATAESRIADPDDPTRVFSWLICESYDDTGNGIVYEYKAENSDGVDLDLAHERNRTAASRSANRYLKRIRYGNRESRLTRPDPAAWMFEVVFDYGEHDADNPRPDEDQPWLCRHDPFSTYRPGFELRSYRLCQRVLMFHHFPEEADVGQGCLVRSTDLVYRDIRDNPADSRRGHPSASFIASIAQRGYRRRHGGGYLAKALPPIEFSYSQAIIDETVRELDPASLKNLPSGLESTTYRWVDLDGEGVSGILTEQASAWFYKPNLGDGRFGPLQVIAARPSLAELDAGRQELLDLAGDGQLDLVDFAGPTPGFFERSPEQGWSSFRTFRELPNLAWDNPSLRFVDLTGDGLADILITEDDVFTWFPSLAEEGFGPALRAYHPLDEERGPRLVFAERQQGLYLADMSGDGLADLVRIRNNEVCYWPSLGYGRFGAKVTMDDAPWFDEPDQFEQTRLRIVDIDGSGTTDIIYLHRDGARIYFNRAGNTWSAVRTLGHAFPRSDTPSDVTAVDLLGNGTACLVWSSPLPSEYGRQLRYIDLMGGQKPHLLTVVRNNLGAETHIEYAPSTRFYLADKAAGRPWPTRLPFPVHVIERVETIDRISRNRFVTRYTYHHGHYDGVEREFRGFGRVDQLDTEEFAALSDGGLLPEVLNIDAASHVPPVLTRTWFHVGAFTEDERISRQFADEYYRESAHGAADPDELRLPDTVLPDTLRRPGREARPWRLAPDELRQAVRALKGFMLRQEIYALDGSPAAGRPYNVTEGNYTIEMLQPAARQSLDRVGQYFAVFFVHPRETVTAHYERMLYPVDGVLRADPRVSHELVLAVNDFGQVLRSATVGYGRRHPDPDPVLTPADRAQQGRTHLLYSENRYTNLIDAPDAYRTPRPAEMRTWEVLGLRPEASRPGSTNLIGFDELARKLAPVAAGDYDLPAERWDADPAGLAAPARRLVDHSRTVFRRDDLSGPLPLGSIESMGLPFERYQLAFTPGLLAELYGERVDEGMLEAGGHVRDEAGWWIPSGQVFFSPTVDDPPPVELAHARQHFFLPLRFRDPFGATSSATYDAYDLLTQETRDAVGNSITAGERDEDGRLVVQGNDYRVLLPRLSMDANRNRAVVAFDALALVVATALMGKPEERLGDTLADFDPDPDDDLVAAHLADPLADPHRLLQGATTRLVYDLFAYQRTQNDPQPQPPTVATMARETHVADLEGDQRTRLQHSVTYSDGLGREIQKKAQAEPGPLVDGGPEVNPRWVGSGWTIYNNKGKPVRQFEPFFSADHHFEFAQIVGVSPVLFYDPVERVVATLHPNDTWEKVVFDPWRQATWDVNDTVLRDPRTDADVGGYVRAYLTGQKDWGTWHAQRAEGQLGHTEQAAAAKAAAHADTPTQVWFDSHGRSMLTVAHNRLGRDGAAVEEHYAMRVLFDFEDNQREVIDARGRSVVRYGYDMLSNRLRHESMDAGLHLTLNDVAAQPIYSWNSRGFRTRIEYDAARRTARVFVQGLDAQHPERELLCERTEYGEELPDAEGRNLRGRTHRQYDGAGVVSSESYDFKGNLLHTARQLAAEYRQTPDWGGQVELEAAHYTNRTIYDALNRPARMTTPDASTIRPVYNEAGLLERLEANLRGAEAVTTFIEGIDYNARGQRTAIDYANGVQTTYSHDPLTFRLTRLRTMRGGTALQDFTYTFDPTGNITHLHDAAQQTVYFRNRKVDPHAEYTYDAIYRLVEASGREHLGQAAGGLEPVPLAASDALRLRLAHPNDGEAMGRYVQRYGYDEVGNILEMIHRGGSPAHPGWRRAYQYAEPSLLEAGQSSNRLSATLTGDDELEAYAYDAHGSTTAMPHLPLMLWDHKDQLQATARQVVRNGGAPETTYYVYDATGRRVRKATERQAAAGQAPARKSEVIYLGGVEIVRKFGGHGAVELERETLHMMDNQQRVALVETRTVGEDEGPAQVLRYQLANHLRSSSLELDDTARIIAYEEYYPFGSTSYEAVRSRTETPRRYRYTGKERDEESGLYYYGARYYAPWLARWTSVDPPSVRDYLESDGAPYTYVQNRPTIAIDTDGNLVWFLVAAVVVAVVATPQIANAPAPDTPTYTRSTSELALNMTENAIMLYSLPRLAVGGAAVLAEQGLVRGGVSLAGRVGVGAATATVVQETANQVDPSGRLGRVINISLALYGLRPRTAAPPPRTPPPPARPTQTGGQTGAPPPATPPPAAPPAAAPQPATPPPAAAAPPPAAPPATPPPARTVTVIRRHRAEGNTQVDVGGERWNLPKGTPQSSIPASDPVGNQLQTAATQAAGRWNPGRLTANEFRAIQNAQGRGEWWRARLLERQARGRYVEREVSSQFPNLQWNRQGADILNPATGIRYDVMSGTKTNIDLHARRMPNVLFRMITF